MHTAPIRNLQQSPQLCGCGAHHALLDLVEMENLRWADWFNHHHLFGPIGHMPPGEADANYHAARETLDMTTFPK